MYLNRKAFDPTRTIRKSILGMEKDKDYEETLELIKSKSVFKRDIFELTTERFDEFKTVLGEITEELSKEMETIDPRLEISFRDLGKYYCQLTIAGDVLLFNMHTNVFSFAKDSFYWKSGYLQEDENRGYCGTIQVFNFLADSFRFRRENDIGYMIARIFVNHENHFFVEGKKELGYMFNDFVNSHLGKNCIRKIIYSVIKYCLEFDLYSPNYQDVDQITLRDARSLKDVISLKTGKRLGFQFGSDDGNVTA